MNKKIFTSFMQVIQTIIWLHILSYTTYLIYPTPTSIYKDVPTWLKGLAIYHNDIQNIFYLYFSILFILTLVFFIKKKKNPIKWFFLFLGLLTFLYGYSATRGYTWYFYANVDRTSELIIASVILLALNYLLYAWQTKESIGLSRILIIGQISILIFLLLLFFSSIEPSIKFCSIILLFTFPIAIILKNRILCHRSTTKELV